MCTDFVGVLLDLDELASIGNIWLYYLCGKRGWKNDF